MTDILTEPVVEEAEYISSIYNLWQEFDGKCYLVNTLGKGIIRIRDGEKSYVESILLGRPEAREDSRYAAYSALLKEQGFLIDTHFDEQRILEYKYNTHHFSNNFLSLILLPTMKCNFTCPYCFETEKGIRWDDEKIAQLKEFARNYFPFKEYVHITFFGGEPLLEWEGMQSFLAHCMRLQENHNFNFRAGVITNGYLLTEEKARRLIADYGCSTFQITIDGCRRTHNTTRQLGGKNETFDRVLANFKSLLAVKKAHQDKKVYVGLRINLLNNTTTEIADFLDNFTTDEKRYFEAYFRPVYDTGSFCGENVNAEGLENFYSLLDEKGFRRATSLTYEYTYCEGSSGLNTFNIMPDLSIWKCIHNTGVRTPQIGQINANGTLDLQMEKLEYWSRGNPFASPECSKCVYLPLCYGGCPLVFLDRNQRTCFHEKNFNLVQHFLEEKGM